MTVLVTGGHGMVGTALRARLPDALAPRSAELDLRDLAAVDAWLDAHPVDAVIHLAARSGGLGAKLADPTGFFVDNLRIVTHVLESAHRHGVPRLVLIGSACVYPLDADQPIREEALFTGRLEPANEGYGLAKACGTRLCAWLGAQYGRQHLTLHPCNLIGPHDRFDPALAQVVPSLIGRFHKARMERAPEVSIWGSGRARREFLFVDDLVEAILHFLAVPMPDPPWLNVGSGGDVTIRELAETIAEVTEYEGRIVFDTSKPDGSMRRLLDSGRAAELGWRARTSLRDALRSTYAWYRENEATIGPR
jgi:GDP-L-fucose synthase